MSDEDKKKELLKYKKYQKNNLGEDGEESEQDYEERIKIAISNENFRHAILSEQIKNVAIRDEENTINKVKNQDIYQIILIKIV